MKELTVVRDKIKMPSNDSVDPSETLSFIDLESGRGSSRTESLPQARRSANILQSVTSEYDKIVTVIGLTSLCTVPLIIILVITHQAQLQMISEKLRYVSKELNSTNFQLKGVLGMLDEIQNGEPYEKISEYGYFHKCRKRMNYLDGQNECSKILGHIIEFDERARSNPEDSSDKIHAIYERFGESAFYVGLTNLPNKHIWKWSSSGRSLSFHKQGSGKNDQTDMSSLTFNSASLLQRDVLAKMSKKSFVD